MLNFQSIRVQNFRAKNFRNLLLRWISDVCSCQKGARKFHKKLYLPLHPLSSKIEWGLCIYLYWSSSFIVRNKCPTNRPNHLNWKRQQESEKVLISFHFISLPVWVANQKTKSSKSNGTSTGIQQKHNIFSSNENQTTQNKSYSLLVCTKLFSLYFFLSFKHLWIELVENA